MLKTRPSSGYASHHACASEVDDTIEEIVMWVVDGELDLSSCGEAPHQQ
jgi:hypothetical protein